MNTEFPGQKGYRLASDLSERTAEKAERKKMRILIHGETKPAGGQDGFILLRDMLVMFVVIICFAAVLGSLAVVSRQGSRLIETVESEIASRNEAVLRMVNR